MKKILHRLTLILIAFLLVACRGEQPKPAASSSKSEEASKQVENISTAAKPGPALAPQKKGPFVQKGQLIKGALSGSLSHYVEDRAVWNDFLEGPYKEKAQDPVWGVHLPRILLESEDAKKANQKIDETVAYLKKEFQALDPSFHSEELGINASFSVYEEDHLLSVHLEASNGGDGGQVIHQIFNFSLPDGRFLSDQALLAHFGLDQEEGLSMMEESIRYEYEKSKDINYFNPKGYAYLEDSDNYEGLTLDNLWMGKDQPEPRYYLDSTGTLMFLYRAYLAFGEGRYLQSIPLQALPVNYRPTSKPFVRLARAAGFQEDDDQVQAFLFYLGSARDEDQLKKLLTDLFPFQSLFSDFQEPMLFLPIRENPNYANGELLGDDYYLLVAKWEKATVRMKEWAQKGDAAGKAQANPLLDRIGGRAPVLFCQKQDQQSTNMKITLRYRDTTIEFMPQHNEKGEIIHLPEGIVDGGKLVNWKQWIQKDFYSTTLFEKILSVMGRG